MTFTLNELVREEAAKRDRNWDPQQRWQVLQNTIAWAEAQATVRRNTKAACLANQARLLKGLSKSEPQPGGPPADA
jgi:hypothetical protein